MLAGKLALVTGATSGIGLKTARVFAQNGATLVLADIKNNFEGVLKEIESVSKIDSKDHLTQTCDVRSSNDVNKLFQTIKEKYPQHLSPSIVVNSAGIAKSNQLATMSEEDFDSIIDTNLKGYFLVTQAAIRELINNHKNVNLSPYQTYGSIIHFSSVIGKYGSPNFSHYSASKAGLEGLSKSLAREFGRYKIRVNTILPGFIDTPMTEPLEEKNKQALIRMIPLLRIGKPEEVAQLCLFLASDASSYITGASIDCNGGLTL